MIDLRPCLFACDKRPEIVYSSGRGFRAECECGACGPSAASVEQAAAAWNAALRKQDLTPVMADVIRDIRQYVSLVQPSKLRVELAALVEKLRDQGADSSSSEVHVAYCEAAFDLNAILERVSPGSLEVCSTCLYWTVLEDDRSNGDCGFHSRQGLECITPAAGFCYGWKRK